MGAAYRTHVANGVSDTGALTHDSDPITVVAGDVLYAHFVSSDNTPVAPTGVVWDPGGADEAFSNIKAHQVYGTYYGASLWRLVAPTPGTGIVRTTLPASQGERLVIVVATSTVDGATPNGTIGQGLNSPGSTFAVSATATTVAGQTVLAFASLASSGTQFAFDNPSGTERVEASTSGTPYDTAAMQDTVASGSSTTMTWSITPTSGYHPEWLIWVVPLNDAAPAGAVLEGDAVAGATATGTLEGSPAALAGGATAGASASGDLTIGNVIGGGGALPNEIEAAAMASATASGALTTQIKLLAAAVSATTAAGSLSTGISLAGAAASVTLAGGALTTQIRLQGDALAAAVAAAGLTTAIQLAAAAQAGAQASGDLTTGAGAAALAGNALASAIAAGALTTIIRLDGAALAGAIAQGVLTTGISLDGAAAVGAAAQGALSTEIRLAGAAIGSALASGDVSGAAQLAGAAIGAALASGDLTTAIRLAGAALAGVQATGDLTAPGSPASLAADAQAIAIAEGGLTTSIRLAGAAASVVQATGSLDVGVTMQASAFVSAMATGVLLTQIRLDAAAVAGALASGWLGGNEFVEGVARHARVVAVVPARAAVRAAVIARARVVLH